MTFQQEQQLQLEAPKMIQSTSSLLPPPKPLDTTGDHWKSWKLWEIHSRHLKPSVVPQQDAVSRLRHIRQRQRYFYNRGTRQLPDLQQEDPVSIFDKQSCTWPPAIVLGPAGSPRSYIDKMEDGREFRRTREHLCATPESQQPSLTAQGSPDSPPLRRSSRQCRSPRRYPARRTERFCDTVLINTNMCC